MNPFEIGRSGGLEVLLVLLLAFLVIGPRKVIRTARRLGRLGQEARNVTSRVSKTVSEIGKVKK